MAEILESVEDAIIDQLRTRMADRLLLVAGFDGVLVDYRLNPDRVWLPAIARTRLAALAAVPGTTLALISGRRVTDLRVRAPLGPAAFYIGLHGLEIEGPGFTRSAEELVERYGDRIHDIAAGFVPSTAAASGVRFEDKGAAAAVHTREAGPVDAIWARLHVLSAAADLISGHQLRVFRGSHVFELVPDVPEPRANAIRAVRRMVEQRDSTPVCVVYVGEDVPDDDAFDALRGEAVTIGIGGRPPRADHQLSSPADVMQLIARLAAERQPR